MLHVMVVDDQSTSRIILEQLVGKLAPDVRVHAFARPKDALDWARRHRPDLVLSDYRMPGLSGTELTRSLRALPHCADIPIVIVTVMEERAIMYAALDAGASDLLTKPVDPRECRARCRNLLALRRQQRLLGVRTRALERLLEGGTGPEDRLGHLTEAVVRELALGPEECSRVRQALAAALRPQVLAAEAGAAALGGRRAR